VEPIATSINGAAKALSLGRTSIYALIKEGRLETVKVGRRTLIKTASIHALIGEGTPSTE
jgi:excisionase family DNA binding protein